MMYEIVNSGNISEPNARQLILNLLAVAEGGRLSVTEAIGAAALFSITENNVRVAIARLTQAKLLEQDGRGNYKLGIHGLELGTDIASWRSFEHRLCAWDGSWIAASTGGLPRSDRKALRGRERALSLLGMRELEHGLYLRPNNFAGGVSAVRTRLAALGLGADATVFLASDFDSERLKRACALWKTEDLLATYSDYCDRIEKWFAKAPNQPLDVAARQSFLLGNSAIRTLVFDPMLPPPLIDSDLRHVFIEAVKRLDDCGRLIWAQFLGSLNDAKIDQAKDQ